MSQVITVQALKYDLTVRREWKCQVVDISSDPIQLIGHFEALVEHPDIGRIDKGTVSYEYFWRSKWLNVFRFHEPAGKLRNWYCNIGMPPTIDGDRLTYVDLDIDVLVFPDKSPVVLDEDEFAVNAKVYGYPVNVLCEVEMAKQELLEMIEDKAFPFNQGLT